LRRAYKQYTGCNSSNPSSVLTGRKPRKATKTIVILTKIFAEI